MSARARCASGPQQSGFDDAMPSVNSTKPTCIPEWHGICQFSSCAGLAARSCRHSLRQQCSDFGLSVPFDMRPVMGSLQSSGHEQVLRIPRCRFQVSTKSRAVVMAYGVDVVAATELRSYSSPYSNFRTAMDSSARRRSLSLIAWSWLTYLAAKVRTHSSGS